MLQKLKSSLTSQILLGMFLGIFVGLFFGEFAAGLESIGMVYVRLLQMTILPYIMFSLIVGFGSLTYDRAWLLAKRAGLFLLAFWGIGLTVVLLMAMTFPARESASFFNPSMLEEPEDVSLVEMFVPSNPFEALATSAIPAVVLFSILFGLALIAVPKKEAVLDVFGVVAKALQRVTSFVVKVTPLGVFGLTAAAAGTLNGDDVVRLQVYFVSYIGCCLFLTFVAFPMVMSMLTPFSYQQVLRVSRDALITAFTTGNLFVVLPILIEDCQRMFREACPEEKDADFYIDILIPVTFNFPNMGKLTAVLFIFFGGWFVGQPFNVPQSLQTIATAIPVFFGGIDIAVPYMLQLEGLPQDLFSLYVLSGIINGRFATLLACMELLCFTLVAVSSLLGYLQISLRKILVGALCLLVGGLAMMTSARMLLQHLVPSANELAQVVKQMHVERKVLERVFEVPPELPLEDGSAGVKRGFFARLFDDSSGVGAGVGPGTVKERRILRVGFFESNLPWSYRNAAGDLAGYDVEVAHLLAAHLNCTLEFYPVTAMDAHRYLDAGVLDVVMSGIPITSENISRYTFSQSYLQLHLALMIPRADERLQTVYASSEMLRKAEGLEVGYVPPSPFLPKVRALFPNLLMVPHASYRSFFEETRGSSQVLYTSAEAGSALSLLFPDYSVMLVGKDSTYNLAYAVQPNDLDFLVFMNQWLALQKHGGVLERSYDYWILGHPRQNPAPRWSIARNVLGWWSE